MTGLLDECFRLYKTRDLYDLLGIDKSATESQVKRAYYKLSLVVHPDRVDDKDKEAATVKFQILGRVYSVLSDSSRRALYDESGEVDDDSDPSSDKDWQQYWRILYPKISLDDIKDFEIKYKGSGEELSDLKAAYCECEGDMELILETVLCATQEDESRFKEILKNMIKSNTIPAFKNFTKENTRKENARKRKAAREAQEAEELKKELGLSADGSLRALIAQRQNSRQQQSDNFFTHLEEKYAKPKAKKK